MLLNQLQNHLARLYAAPTDYDIYDFLITDADAANRLTPRGQQNNQERLLVSQTDDALNISVYVDANALERLSADDPMIGLHEGNLPAFLLALEGVSHFHYLCWNAVYDKPVTLLELELQAEVDKFVTAISLLDAQRKQIHPGKIHERLFEHIRFRADLSAEHRNRYREANRYAAKYCYSLNSDFPPTQDGSRLADELRRFYRLTQNGKIHRIERGRNPSAP